MSVLSTQGIMAVLNIQGINRYEPRSFRSTGILHHRLNIEL